MSRRPVKPWSSSCLEVSTAVEAMGPTWIQVTAMAETMGGTSREVEEVVFHRI
jgi:hypothetical protein